jgi:hypothetical protein
MEIGRTRSCCAYEALEQTRVTDILGVTSRQPVSVRVCVCACACVYGTNKQMLRIAGQRTELAAAEKVAIIQYRLRFAEVKTGGRYIVLSDVRGRTCVRACVYVRKQSSSCVYVQRAT